MSAFFCARRALNPQQDRTDRSQTLPNRVAEREDGRPTQAEPATCRLLCYCLNDLLAQWRSQATVIESGVAIGCEKKKEGEEREGEEDKFYVGTNLIE